MALTWLIVTILGSMVLLWNRSFIGLWVGSSHFVGSLPDLLIVLVVMQFILIRNDGNVIDLSLRLKQKVIVGAISVGLSLAIAVIMIQWLNLGIVGICLGLIIGRLLLSIGYPLLVGKLLGVTFISQLKSSIRPGLVTALFFVTATLFDRFRMITLEANIAGWMRLGLMGLSSLLIVSVLVFYMGLSSNQRNNVIQRVRIVFSFTKN